MHLYRNFLLYFRSPIQKIFVVETTFDQPTNGTICCHYGPWLPIGVLRRLWFPLAVCLLHWCSRRSVLWIILRVLYPNLLQKSSQGKISNVSGPIYFHKCNEWKRMQDYYLLISSYLKIWFAYLNIFFLVGIENCCSTFFTRIFFRFFRSETPMEI